MIQSLRNSKEKVVKFVVELLSPNISQQLNAKNVKKLCMRNVIVVILIAANLSLATCAYTKEENRYV